MDALDHRLRQIAGYAIKRSNSVVLAGVNEVLQPFGLRHVSFSALSVIVERAGLRQAQLADALAIERPNIVAIVDGLQKAKLVTRQRATDDRRAYALHPTQQGRQVYEKSLPAVQAFDRKLLEGISAEDRQTLIRVLRQMEQNGVRQCAEGGQHVPTS